MRAITVVLLSLSAATLAARQGPAALQWQDPSEHQVRFVTVQQGVSLEVLDWGGSGRSILLLAGSGHTAHVFDEFAPKLSDCCHVYGVTRRGYGASSRPSSGYDDQRLADDVLQVIEQEHIQNPVLVGHSMSGGEMTTLGRRHSNRLGGLVYLDALGDLEDDPAADPEWVALQQALPAGLLPQAMCNPTDRSSFAAYRLSLACRLGFALPESELRNQFEDVGGSAGSPKSPASIDRAVGQGQVYRRDYSGIRVPALVLLNAAQTIEAVLAASGYLPKDDKERAAIERFMAKTSILVGRWTDKLTRNVPDARIVYMPLAGHYLLITRETEVLREIHTLVAAVDTSAK